MTKDEFQGLLESRIEKIKQTLQNKSLEYATEDRLYNFKRSSIILNTTPRKALWGMAMKHLISVIDLVEGRLNDSYADEKIGDLINYLILLEAVIQEDIKNRLLTLQDELKQVR